MAYRVRAIGQVGAGVRAGARNGIAPPQPQCTISEHRRRLRRHPVAVALPRSSRRGRYLKVAATARLRDLTKQLRAVAVCANELGDDWCGPREQRVCERCAVNPDNDICTCHCVRHRAEAYLASADEAIVLLHFVLSFLA